jgi:lipopolysaccharide transport system permease protein
VILRQALPGSLPTPVTLAVVKPVDATGPEQFEIVLKPDAGWRSLQLASIWQYRDLLSLLVWRDFVSKYKQTILGPLWFIIQPLSMTLVFTVIFGKVAGLSTDGVPPVLFYLCGQLGWNYFAQNFSSNSATFVANAGLFGKVYFPRLVVPLAALVSNLFAFLIQAATFACFYIYFKYGRGAPGFGMDWHVILLPLLVLQTAILSLGVGLVISALTAKYRDLTHVTALLIQVWMYATPVIYPLSAFPPQWRWVALLNPMTPIVEGFRLLLLGVGTVQPVDVISSVAITAVVTVGGLLLFGRIEKTFVDIV